jgi:UBA-like domain
MNEEDKVADFQSLTSVPAEVARNMLEATNWDIEVHQRAPNNRIPNCRRKLD